jgi:hypothetical protein
MEPGDGMSSALTEYSSPNPNGGSKSMTRIWASPDAPAKLPMEKLNAVVS